MGWSVTPKLDIMHYFLYDLRENPSIAQIHLPGPSEDGPVLLLHDKKDYIDLYSELGEMNENEGWHWMTCLIMKPMGSKNASDMLDDLPYILVAHMDFVRDDVEGFLDKLTTMQKLVTN